MERLNIYIPDELQNRLKQDMDLFGYYDKNHKLLQNKFLNDVIQSYFDEYNDKLDKLYSSLAETLNLDYDDKNSIKLLEQILSITTKEFSDNNSEKMKRFALRFTSETDFIFDELTITKLNNRSLSKYIRDLLTSFANLSMVERARTLQKNDYENIKKCIKEHKKLYAKFKRTGHSYVVTPYKIIQDKSNLYDYVLIYDGDKETKPYAYKIINLSMTKVSNEKADKIPEKVINGFKTMDINRYFLVDDNQTNSIVKFTENGLSLLYNTKLNRPNFIMIDSNHAQFNCGEKELYFYLLKFGEDAVVIEPSSLNKELNNFYTKAAKAYKDIKKSKI